MMTMILSLALSTVPADCAETRARAVEACFWARLRCTDEPGKDHGQLAECARAGGECLAVADVAAAACVAPVAPVQAQRYRCEAVCHYLAGSCEVANLRAPSTGGYVFACDAERRACEASCSPQVQRRTVRPPGRIVAR